MAEYIEREAAVKLARHAYNQWNLAMAGADGRREINLVYKRQELCKAVELVFADSPSADVAPVVHSRWEECDYVEPCVHGFGTIRTPDAGLKCKHCAHVFKKQLLWKENYCPNCGAKMDLED